MKLDVEHLLPYFQYNLKVMGFSKYYRSKKFKYKILLLHKIEIPDNDMNSTKYAVLGCTDSEIGYQHAYSLGEIKPILRPLSDLPKFGSNGYFNSNRIVDLYNCYNKKDVDDRFMDYYISKLTHSDLELLYKFFFDIRRLIEKGLAVNINETTIKNE